MHTNNSVLIAGQWGEVEEGAGGNMVMDGDETWGGEHTTQCREDVLWNCAPETCIILLTSVTPINSIKWKEIF